MVVPEGKTVYIGSKRYKPGSTIKDSLLPSKMADKIKNKKNNGVVKNIAPNDTGKNSK